jgi:hypothetical protein
LGIILLLAVFLFMWAFYRPDGSIREGLLRAAVAFGLTLTLITEMLSLFRLLTPTGLFLAWVLVCTGLVLVLRRHGIRLPRLIPTRSPLETGALALGLALIIAATVVTAVLGAPNTWDSMTYHLSRVMHWLQNASVGHYPTDILRQIYQNPWAEFAVLHLVALTGGDRVAALVQWSAMIGALVAVSRIARALGADRRGEWFAAFVCATIPMGVMQASSTQTDYVVAFWTLCAVYFMLTTRDVPLSLLDTLMLGGSMGLAFFTKPTAAAYLLPFALWWGVSRLRMAGGWRGVALVTVVALAVNTGQFARHLQLFGSPLPQGEVTESYANTPISLAALGSNLARSVALQMLTPNEDWNEAVEEGLVALHERFGLALNDPATTYLGGDWLGLNWEMDEQNAATPLHLALALLAAGVLVAGWLHGQRENRPALVYAALILAGLVVLALVFKWHRWYTRFYLPPMALAAAFAGLALARLRWHWLARGALTALFVGALPFLFLNQVRPLLPTEDVPSIYDTGRTVEYFNYREEELDEYREAVEEVAETDCEQVGLMGDRGSWEYPLWQMLSAAAGEPVELRYVAVDNVTARAEDDPTFRPCVVLAMNVIDDERVIDRVIDIEGREFRGVWAEPPLGLYVPVQ